MLTAALITLLTLLALYYRSQIPDPELMKDVQWFAQATGWKSPKSVGREIHRIFYENNTLRRRNERQERLIEDLSTQQSNLENEARRSHAVASEWRQRAERAEVAYLEMKAEAEEIIEAKDREIDSKNEENLPGWTCSVATDGPIQWYYEPDFLAKKLKVAPSFTAPLRSSERGKISFYDMQAVKTIHNGTNFYYATTYAHGDDLTLYGVFEWDHDQQAWKAC